MGIGIWVIKAMSALMSVILLLDLVLLIFFPGRALVNKTQLKGPNRPLTKSPYSPQKEIKPPWIKFPGYLPLDGFWRQTGEPWFYYIWKPYWDSLDGSSQKDYLKKYEVPEKWKRFYFDPEYQNWLSENVTKDSALEHILKM